VAEVVAVRPHVLFNIVVVEQVELAILETVAKLHLDHPVYMVEQAEEEVAAVQLVVAAVVAEQVYTVLVVLVPVVESTVALVLVVLAEVLVLELMEVPMAAVAAVPEALIILVLAVELAVAVLFV
jgi:hypothetical protein